ncbi:hypothetical protein EV693_11170 [Nicoletella semolina]|uniref:TIGR01777 family protein n=1 Tax=Nicoletella semolina TaxID=271160 RepID=A0A4R2N6I6_9PAST|nr:TIGR01777 family oxidoreductase [Nicoletella semolina]MDH2925159.1 epimerase [Nicoletella semolina]TCP16530.1 hypothetical protein EV693_11170 [Nicoletella semolina]
MRIFIAGGTGFIGQALCRALVKRGDQLTVLSRQPLMDTQAVRFCQNIAEFTDFNAFDAVINLAGEPIFDKRWAVVQKEKLLKSRIGITQQIVQRIEQSEDPPKVFLSGSATGFYGNLPNAKMYTEQTASGTHFAADICRQWESEAMKASHQTRLCLLRTGMVLDSSGGALKKMLPLFRLGLAGKIGNGKQCWAWISLYDHVRAMLFLLDNPACSGAFNFVAPQAVSNANFTATLASALNRPAFLCVPEFMLKMVLGERSQLLLDNQPLYPQKLLQAGFKFKEPELAPFLAKLMNRKRYL